MDRIGFLCSGQGDQYPGMGKDFYDQYPAAKEVFQLCERLRPGTIDQCFFGTEEELRQTKNTQPCLFSMELAAAAALKSTGITPQAAAGFSLGEVTAAVVSGLLDPETGFRLVCRRGVLMQREAEKTDAFMAAVVKLSKEQVEQICLDFSQVYPVNFNCPGQITVSGLKSQMEEFYGAVRAMGGRAIPLKVAGGFHSPFMEKAAKEFEKELQNISMGSPAIPLYSNVIAAPYGEDGRTLLAEQIKSPVRWEALIRRMIADGIDTFVELGPGSTLTNMMKKIDPHVKAVSLLGDWKEICRC